jgi:hypothetical protein
MLEKIRENIAYMYKGFKVSIFRGLIIFSQ